MRFVLAMVLVVLAAPGAAQARVPAHFFGSVWDAEIAKNAPDAVQDREWARMAATGVRATRTPFEWVKVEPERGQFDFSTTDRVVSLSARHGGELPPVVLYAPPWPRQRPANFASPPADPADYAQFLTTLIGRYGPNGSFWTEHPELPRQPIRNWQIWNEPHLPYQWDVRPGDD